MNNYERIKNMSIEEMAEKITESVDLSCVLSHYYCKANCDNKDDCPHDKECCIKWLMQEVK